jgi:hypothetical protein
MPYKDLPLLKLHGKFTAILRLNPRLQQAPDVFGHVLVGMG